MLYQNGEFSGIIQHSLKEIVKSEYKPTVLFLPTNLPKHASLS